MKEKIEIDIPLKDEKILVEIFPQKTNEQTIFEPSDAEENGEARYQIQEGCFYEYRINKTGYYLEALNSAIITQSRAHSDSGTISPNIYVGTLPVKIKKDSDTVGKFELEVRSSKTTYRNDYRLMLEEIAERCTELLLLHTSPVIQNFEPDYSADAQSLYQQFSFIKSVLDTEEFDEAIHKILNAPVTKWKETETVKDIRNIRRFRRNEIKQLLSSNKRTDLPNEHSLKNVFKSIPLTLKVNHKTETADTPENRFIKHALTTFHQLLNKISSAEKASSRLKKESAMFEEKLEHYMSHSLFKEVSDPTMLPLNSPVLQRKEGYREVLKIWLMYEIAAKLIWKGGDDVYSAGKKDVAVLYEYWVYFKLLDVISEVFKIQLKNVNDFITITEERLEFNLKQGNYCPVQGTYKSEGRELEIKFSYNKKFNNGNNYDKAGSWTKNMRPDYTLTIWPKGIPEEEAEREEIIVHIHFDAKYKAELITDIVGTNDAADIEKEENRKGVYRRADLLKMHAYKDAIRRSAGAYVLYPGKESEKWTGFHELIPGLGAFTIRPSKTDDGTRDLREFLNDVLNHFLNRASQREKFSFHTYKTFKNKPGDNDIISEKLPEPYGANRDLIPDEIYVLVGYYKNSDHLAWIQKHNLYNIRTGDASGARSISSKEALSRYLLLYGDSERESILFFKISSDGPVVMTKERLDDLDYPAAKYPAYLVYELHQAEPEFTDKKWNVRNLSQYYEEQIHSPFTVTMSELMKSIIR